MASSLRPLKRLGSGAWQTRDGSWTFLRHHSDPNPQRWYAYRGDEEAPANLGGGETTLRGVLAFAEAADA